LCKQLGLTGALRRSEANQDYQAANTRKRLIQRLQNKPGAEFDALLKKELLFVDSYLTSRLHRHTKSPTLWGHRRWLVALFAAIHPKRDVLEDLQSVVLVAAERHPKNYYAWSHMRWLTRTYTCSTESSLNSNDLSRIITITKDWCLRHPNDTSGLSFLLFILSYSQSVTYGDIELGNMSSAVCEDVLRLAVSFKWTHESIWVFLRTVVAGYGSELDKRAFHVAIDDLAKVCPENETLLRRASDWCSKYQQDSGLEP
jgi:protein prenyltransferase alpha subunit repeat containing protein 1